MFAPKSKNIYSKAKGLSYRKEAILYAPSDLLNQVEKQALAEFGDQITDFEWSHEDEFTAIMVEIRSILKQIPVGERIREIVNSLIGEEYIVAIGVWAVESVNATNGLFNLTFYGGTSFGIDYYPPERPNRFKIPVHYTKMFKAIRTIHFDSAEELWQGLVHPALPKIAKREGVDSFCKALLADKLRDFLKEHLDFIKYVADATKKPLHIFEPIAQPQSSNGTEPKTSEVRPIKVPSNSQVVLQTPVPA